PVAHRLQYNVGDGASARRPSALPTPVKRRTSTFQAPSDQTRTFRLPSRTDTSITRCTNSAEKPHSPVPQGKQEEEPVHFSDIKPFRLEEEESPATLPLNSPETKQTHNSDPGMLTVSETVPNSNPIELEMTEESAVKTQEVLLLDLPPPALQPQEKLLIDLANTPNLIGTKSKSCTTTQVTHLSPATFTVGSLNISDSVMISLSCRGQPVFNFLSFQLIDLSSPLIKWSPEDKKENNAPLINLSF
ncbi:hypothetical protein XENOCAPTIV_018185, partial [Xenoophorus captivus]